MSILTTHTQAPAHMSILTTHTQAPAHMEQKTCQVYSFGKRKGWRFDLNESSEGLCWRGRGRSLHTEGPKTGKVPEPAVGESGARNLKAKTITCHMTFSFLSNRSPLWTHSNLI